MRHAIFPSQPIWSSPTRRYFLFYSGPSFLWALGDAIQALCCLTSSKILTSIFPQTGLALMGFSRFCPSSLDLPNFVVRECRGATAEEWSSRSKSAQAWPRPRSGNLEIWGPGNPEIWDPKNEKNKKLSQRDPN